MNSAVNRRDAETRRKRRESRLFLRIFTPIVLILLVFACPDLMAAELIRKDIEYAITKGDYGEIIAGKVGMNWDSIARENSLDPEATLTEGQVLKVRFARIVPERMENGILINIPDRTLYRFEQGKVKDYFFIAAGKPTWQTPLGEFVITAKAKDPTWYVPPSIRKEMEAEGNDILLEVPSGPDNPLGEYWLQLSIKGIGLHGTNAPQSIYKFRSHGCMRLRPDVAEFLYKKVPVGTKGKIVYQPVKIIRAAEGRILMEVYRDFYRRGINYPEEVKRTLRELNATDRVDWDKVEGAIKRRDGIVTDVSKETGLQSLRKGEY